MSNDPATGRQTRVWTTPDTSAASPITSDVFYAYDPFGRLTTVTTARQRGVSLPTPEEGQLYYGGGDPSRPTDIPNPEVTRYYYDAANQLIKTLQPTEVWTLYEYDPQGRVRMVVNAAESGGTDPTTTAGYDPLKVQPDSRFLYTRDAAGRITRVDELLRRPGLNSVGWDASRVDYVYDALGRLTKETRLISNPFGALYSPDLDWLSQVNQASFQRNGYVVDYTLDLVGNRVEQVRKQSTYTAYRSTSETVSYERTTSQFDARDRLFSEVGESRPTTTAAWSPLFDVDYVYDANGSLESKTRTGALPETTTYEFDVRNRLAGTERNRLVPIGTTTATQSQTLVGQYVYDDAGIRTRVRETTTTGNGASAVVTTTITDYLVDHQNPTGYAQAIEERVTSATGTVASPPVVNPPLASALPTVSYVFGHELITQARAGASATSQPRTAIYRHDAHSGVRQLVGTSTAYPLTTIVYDNYTYEAFGTLLANPSQISNRGTTNTHLYRGEVWDAGLGLTYLRARYVDHRTGRFVGMDPWEGSLQNPLTFQDFVYAASDPVQHVDPSGRAAFAVYLAAFALVAAVGGIAYLTAPTFSGYSTEASAALADIDVHANDFRHDAEQRIRDLIHPITHDYAGVPVTESQRLVVASKVATAYVEAVSTFIKSHPGARPRQGSRSRVWELLGLADEQSQPWCADWQQGIFGLLRGPISDDPEVSRLVGLAWAQNFTSGALQSQHNWNVLFPRGIGPDGNRLPELASNYETLPSGASIIHLDPWFDLLPRVYSHEEHEKLSPLTHLNGFAPDPALLSGDIYGSDVCWEAGPLF